MRADAMWLAYSAPASHGAFTHRYARYPHRARFSAGWNCPFQTNRNAVLPSTSVSVHQWVIFVYGFHSGPSLDAIR